MKKQPKSSYNALDHMNLEELLNALDGYYNNKAGTNWDIPTITEVKKRILELARKGKLR